MSSISTSRGLVEKSDEALIKPPKARMYYADWIRVIAVHSVIFVHCLLNAADTVDLKDRDAIEKKEGICKVMA
jgi:peptidoglycan/LPS O-acetylase OafA/YrhL